MTDDPLDALLADQPIAEATINVATVRRCRRHVWHTVDLNPSMTYCARCNIKYDAIKSRRGRNARKRGNALQAKAAQSAGIQNIGALGLPEDAGNSTDWMRIQHKSGQGYPKLLDRWLRAITVNADQLRAVVYTSTPGPGHKAKRLVVLDYDEFLLWFGPARKNDVRP